MILLFLVYWLVPLAFVAWPHFFLIVRDFRDFFQGLYGLAIGKLISIGLQFAINFCEYFL